jgi:hypothetical protein
MGVQAASGAITRGRRMVCSRAGSDGSEGGMAGTRREGRSVGLHLPLPVPESTLQRAMLDESVLHQRCTNEYVQSLPSYERSHQFLSSSSRRIPPAASYLIK